MTYIVDVRSQATGRPLRKIALSRDRDLHVVKRIIDPDTGRNLDHKVYPFILSAAHAENYGRALAREAGPVDVKVETVDGFLVAHSFVGEFGFWRNVQKAFGMEVDEPEKLILAGSDDDFAIVCWVDGDRYFLVEEERYADISTRTFRWRPHSLDRISVWKILDMLSRHGRTSRHRSLALLARNRLHRRFHEKAAA